MAPNKLSSARSENVEILPLIAFFSKFLSACRRLFQTKLNFVPINQNFTPHLYIGPVLSPITSLAEINPLGP